MKKYIGFAVIICMATIACNSNKPGKPLLTVNSKTITEGDLEFLGNVNPRIKAQLNNPLGKKQIIDNLIEQELFFQAAQDKGLDKDPNVKDKIDLYRRVIIAQSYVENQLDVESRKHYDGNKEEFERLKLSDIMIKVCPAAVKPDKSCHSDAEALEIANTVKARLDKKEDFAMIAKEISEDAVTKANGGDMGAVAKKDQRLIRRGYEPLIDKAFAMQVNEIAGPIKTEDGYHIITVTRGIEVEPFADAKQGITFKLQGEIRNKLLGDLKKSAKITFVDASLKPQDAPAAPPADTYGKPTVPTP